MLFDRCHSKNRKRLYDHTKHVLQIRCKILLVHALPDVRHGMKRIISLFPVKVSETKMKRPAGMHLHCHVSRSHSTRSQLTTPFLLLVRRIDIDIQPGKSPRIVIYSRASDIQTAALARREGGRDRANPATGAAGCVLVQWNSESFAKRGPPPPLPLSPIGLHLRIFYMLPSSSLIEFSIHARQEDETLGMLRRWMHFQD